MARKKKTFEEIKAETDEIRVRAMETGEPIFLTTQVANGSVSVAADFSYIGNSAAAGNTADTVFDIQYGEPEYERMDEFGRTMNFLFWVIVVCVILGAASVFIHKLL